ncbi:MAG: hypothetical protein AAGA60_09490 [Cyanobacteria bacterium P01_E01_bin.42]
MKEINAGIAFAIRLCHAIANAAFSAMATIAIAPFATDAAPNWEESTLAREDMGVDFGTP